METGTIMRTGAILVAFAVAVSRGRRTWMLADTGAVLLFGLAWLSTPWIILDFMTTGSLDKDHMLIGRVYGAILVGSAVMYYRTRNSGDITVSNTLLYSRVVGISMQLLSVGYHLYYRDMEKGGWNQELVWFGLVGSGVWLLGNLYHWINTDQFGCYGARNDHLSAALRADGCSQLLVALINFSFPDFMLSFMGVQDMAVDGVHLHVLRCYGAGMFMSALVSSWAPVFLKDEDKRNVLMGRLVQSTLGLATFMWYLRNKLNLGVLATYSYYGFTIGILAWGYIAPTGKKTA